MQTILGANGVIGKELAKVLHQNYEAEIRLVSRKPIKVNATDELLAADLLDKPSTLRALEGSYIAYLTVGFPYQYNIWKTAWPKCVANVIEACKMNRTKLIFLDNVYMYDPSYISHMTESTPFNPISKKGKVRAEVATMVLNEMEKGEMDAMIARSADFYGKGATNSILNITTVEALKNGKQVNWLGSPEYLHSFTYTPDIGKALALLAHTDSAFNQTWHLPTAKPIKGKEWIELIANQLKTTPRYRSVGKGMINFLGLFSASMKEVGEMFYQNNQDYVFDSSKFSHHFPHFEITSPEQAIPEMLG